MNSNTAVKVSLGGTHLDGNTEALQNLVAALAEDVQANDSLVRTLADELVGGRTLVLRLHHGVVHGSEAGSVDLDRVTELLTSLGLGKTNAANSGVREDDRGDVGVVEVSVLLATEKTVSKTTSSGDSNGGQFHTSVADVTQSVNAVNIGVLVLVDLDVALVIKLNTGILQIELLDFRCTTDGPQNAVDVHGVLAL